LQSPADSLGPLGFLFLAAPTLREGLLHVTKYIGTWQTGTFIGLQAAGGAALWSYRIETPEIWPRRQDAEYTMMTMCTMIRARFGQNWRPQDVHFEHEAPAESGTLRTLFGAPLKFRQPYNALVLEARALDLAGKSAFECFVPYIERYVHELQMAVEAPADMVTQVRGLVRQGLGHSEISLAWVAQTLGLSPRSLQRHLAASGTSLREIVQEIRSREAMNLLGSATQPQAGVAQALGYTDNTAFWRAFKSWAGVSPRDYKRKASSPGAANVRVGQGRVLVERTSVSPVSGHCCSWPGSSWSGRYRNSGLCGGRAETCPAPGLAAARLPLIPHRPPATHQAPRPS
jgi:AraC-like DNA-binding protein